MGFGEHPLLAFWDATQGIESSCVHCPPSASPRQQALELFSEEAYPLLETVRELGDPRMVLTGSNPPTRPDLLALLGRGVELGLRTNVTPSSTHLMHPLTDLKKRGLE